MAKKVNRNWLKRNKMELEILKTISGATLKAKKYDVKPVDDTRHQLVVEYVTKHQIKAAGDTHQEDFIPLFNDGSVALYTMRAWGSLMSEIWGGDYLDWYVEGGL
jgi:hypothetical protein